jgi:hypothetical protein
MTGSYLQTYNIKDSAGLPILAATVTDTAGMQYTTANGTAFLTESAGTTIVTFTATDYTTRGITYTIDEAATYNVTLLNAAVNMNQNTWYTPHQVRFRILDSYGSPLSNLEVYAGAVTNTLPSDNDLQTIYGINPTAANEMMNGTLLMHGPTGSDGAVVFTMLGSIGYNLNMNNPTRGGQFTTYVMPIDTQYNIWVNTSTIPGGNAAGSVYLAVKDSTLWFTEPNVSYIRLGVNYTDSSGKTSNVKWYVTFGNNKTVLYTKDLGNPGTGTVTDWQDYKNTRGANYVWNYTTVRLA